MKPKGKLVVSLANCIDSKVVCLSRSLMIRKVFGGTVAAGHVG